MTYGTIGACLNVRLDGIEQNQTVMCNSSLKAYMTLVRNYLTTQNQIFNRMQQLSIKFPGNTTLAITASDRRKQGLRAVRVRTWK